MNENQFREQTGALAETMNLDEEIATSPTDGLLGFMRAFFKKIRTGFSQNSERSVFSALIEDLYIRVLAARTRSVAIFLLTFSIASLVISYAINSSLSGFISDINTFSSLVLLTVSAVFFTTNRTFHDLISTSNVLSSLSIVYSEQSNIISRNHISNAENIYSTPFFLGVICGIFTVIYPVSVICSFIVCLICLLLVINRPECGMLIIIAVIPFLSRSMLLTFACVTFISLLYKYLLGKRHINFNFLSSLMAISSIYILTRCLMTDGNVISRRLYIYIVFFIACFTAINLIRTTSMFRRTFFVIVRITRAFSIILILYYLCNIFFGTFTVENFLSAAGFSTLTTSLTSVSFVAPFLSMALPINLAYLISCGRCADTLKNIIYFILIFTCLIYVMSYSAILISILACIGVLAFYNIRFIFLTVPAPFMAYAVIRLFDILPSAYRLSVASQNASDIQYATTIIKANPLFGSGPEIVEFSGNVVLNILMTFGIVGLLLLSCVLIIMLIKSAGALLPGKMKSTGVRFLSVGLFCASLSFITLCIFTDTYCNINAIFLFAAVVSAAVSSGKSYAADYIDAAVVREYKG